MQEAKETQFNTCFQMTLNMFAVRAASEYQRCITDFNSFMITATLKKVLKDLEVD
jgi:hypothetical protein